MLVKLTQDLKNGFLPWKEMLHANGHKLKEHGMTCIFAGTEKENDNKLTVIIDFATPEGMMAFKNDEELTQRRIDAGALVETTVMTPMRFYFFILTTFNHTLTVIIQFIMCFITKITITRFITH